MFNCFKKPIDDNITVIDKLSYPDTSMSSGKFSDTLRAHIDNNDCSALIKLKNEFYTDHADDGIYNKVVEIYNYMLECYKNKEVEIDNILWEKCVSLTKIKKYKYTNCFMKIIMAYFNTFELVQDSNTALEFYNNLITIEKNNIKIDLWKICINCVENNKIFIKNDKYENSSELKMIVNNKWRIRASI